MFGLRSVASRSLLMILIIWSLIVTSFSASAFAYSYGDPNKEDLAEDFVAYQAALQESTPNWKLIQDRLYAREAEIASHFGKTVADELHLHASEKNSQAFEEHYLGLLALNMERRLKYAKENFSNYAEAKKLLAKAYGTYQVLLPYASAVNQQAAIGVRSSLDTLLESLGNPGLFGVGKVEPNESLFDKERANVVDTLKAMFPFLVTKSSKGSTDTSKQSNESMKGGINQSTVASEVISNHNQNGASGSAEPTPIPVEELVPELSVTPTGLPAEPQQTEVQAELPQVDSEMTKTGNVLNHSPLERVDRTNIGVTIGVIIGLILISAAFYWFVFRKKRK